MSNKIDLINELIEEYVNPGLQMHSGSVKVQSYELDKNPPTLKLQFEGMCGECPSSFSQTLTSVANFLKEEAEIDDLLVLNVNEEPDQFNYKYVYDPDEEE